MKNKIKTQFIIDSNNISFVSYFIIKKDREKIPEKILKNTRTFKILSYKEGELSIIDEILSWVKPMLPNRELILIPFPSTNKNKSFEKQLSYHLISKLIKINKKWKNGAGILFRKYSLPKNTRIISKQFDSLGVRRYREIIDKEIIFIDDVTTSGSSLKAGLKLIKKFGVKKIVGLAVAKKVYLKDVPLTGIF